MYYRFYGLKENPFNVTADPDFFFFSKSHNEAMHSLIYGIEERKGILAVSGEVGTGKTTLCRQLLKHFDKNIKFAVILNPNFSELQLMQMIIQDLGIIPKQKNMFALIHALNEFLIAESTKGNNVVLIIDEAQNLSVSQLEKIRLLSNFETQKEKLIQIVLMGQPELDAKLQLPSLRQLQQRVSVYYHLRPLDRQDIQHYVDHRMLKSSESDHITPSVTFTEQAMDAIYRFTRGNPRTINMVCDRALLAGFVAETFSIGASIVESCAKEVMYCEHYI